MTSPRNGRCYYGAVSLGAWLPALLLSPYGRAGLSRDRRLFGHAGNLDARRPWSSRCCSSCSCLCGACTRLNFAGDISCTNGRKLHWRPFCSSRSSVLKSIFGCTAGQAELPGKLAENRRKRFGTRCTSTWCLQSRTVLLWPVVIFLALRNFPNPPQPAQHSRIHVPLARLAAADMMLTAITGWVILLGARFGWHVQSLKRWAWQCPRLQASSRATARTYTMSGRGPLTAWPPPWATRLMALRNASVAASTVSVDTPRPR